MHTVNTPIYTSNFVSRNSESISMVEANHKKYSYSFILQQFLMKTLTLQGSWLFTFKNIIILIYCYKLLIKQAYLLILIAKTIELTHYSSLMKQLFLLQWVREIFVTVLDINLIWRVVSYKKFTEITLLFWGRLSYTVI